VLFAIRADLGQDAHFPQPGRAGRRDSIMDELGYALLGIVLILWVFSLLVWIVVLIIRAILWLVVWTVPMVLWAKRRRDARMQMLAYPNDYCDPYGEEQR
jgi:Flp pilus assembly protein TadB